MANLEHGQSKRPHGILFDNPSKQFLTPYKTLQDLYNSGMFIPRTMVQVTDSAGVKKVYYVTANENILWDVTANQEIRVGTLVGQNLHIARSPQHDVLTTSIVDKIVAKNARDTLKSTGNLITTHQFTTDINRIQYIKDRINRSAFAIGEELEKIVGDADSSFLKRTQAIDLETRVAKRKGVQLMGKDVVTAAISEVEDQYLTSTKHTGKKIRAWREVRSWEDFNLKTLQEWTQKLDGLKSYSGKNNIIMEMLRGQQIEGAIGRKQFGHFLEAMTVRKRAAITHQLALSDAELSAEGLSRKELESQMKKLSAAPDLVELVEKSKGKAHRIEKAFQERYLTLGGEYIRKTVDDAEEVIKRENEWLRVATIEDIKNMSGKNRFNLATYNKIYGPTNQSAEKMIYVGIADDPLFDAARRILSKGKRISHFGQMEPDVFKNEINRLKQMLYGERQTGHSREFLEKKIAVYEQATKLFVDAKPITRIYMQSLTGTFSQVAGGSISFSGEVLRKFGLDDSIIRRLTNNLSTDLSDPLMRGLSQEYVVNVFNRLRDFKTAHLGSADAAELATLFMDHLDNTNPVLRKVSRFTQIGETSAIVEATPDTLYDFTIEAYKKLHSQQLTYEMVTQLDQESIQNVLVKSGVNPEESASLIERHARANLGKARTNQNMDTELTERLRRVLDDQYTKLRKKTLLSTDIHSKKGLSSAARFKAEHPAVLSRLLTSRSAVGLLGLYLTTRILQALDPNETIEHGTHAGLETVARRMMSTDFGSPYSKFGVIAKKVIHKVLNIWPRKGKQNIGNLISDMANDTPRGLPKELFLRDYPSWAPLMDSAAKNVVTKAERMTEIITKDGTVSAGSFIHRLFARFKNVDQGTIRQVDRRLQDMFKRISERGLRKEPTYKLGDTTSRVRKHSAPLIANEDYPRWYVNSGRSRLTETLTNKEAIKRMDGTEGSVGWQFPSGNMQGSGAFDSAIKKNIDGSAHIALNLGESTSRQARMISSEVQREAKQSQVKRAKSIRRYLRLSKDKQIGGIDTPKLTTAPILQPTERYVATIGDTVSGKSISDAYGLNVPHGGWFPTEVSTMKKMPPPQYVMNDMITRPNLINVNETLLKEIKNVPSKTMGVGPNPLLDSRGAKMVVNAPIAIDRYSLFQIPTPITTSSPSYMTRNIVYKQAVGDSVRALNTTHKTSLPNEKMLNKAFAGKQASNNYPGTTQQVWGEIGINSEEMVNMINV